MLELIDEDYTAEPFRQCWEFFWDALTCSYTETIPRLRAEVMGTEDFYGDREWHSTGLSTEILRPAGVERELLIPLPAPPGIARRLVFFRGPGRTFTDTERDAALLLQPHLARALGHQARLTAGRLLTDRQAVILRLVAEGGDNAAIARRLGVTTARQIDQNRAPLMNVRAWTKFAHNRHVRLQHRCRLYVP